MIGVVFAMREELDAFKAMCSDIETYRDRSPHIFRASLADKALVMALSGVGKTHAAHATSLLVSTHDVDGLISVGVAGGIHTPLGNVVIPRRVFYHDVDTTDFGAYQLGQLPGMPGAFECDPRLRRLAQRAVKESGAAWTDGTMASGDRFLSDVSSLAAFEDIYPDIRAVDMESGAVAQIAYIERCPFLAIRTISDVVGAPTQHADYSGFMKRAARQSADVLRRIMLAL